MADEKALYSQEAEDAVLGAVIIDPDLMTQIVLAPDDFYNRRNREVWQTARELSHDGQAVDYLTLCERLERKNKLAEIGGAAFLTALIGHTPTTLHAEAYAGIVRDKARRRRVVQIANALAQAAWDEKSDLDQLTPGVIEQLASTTTVIQAARPLSEYLSELYDQLETRRENPAEVWGIPTGIAKYDRMTGGMQPGELEILSGVPGVGKSMLAMQRAAAMGAASPGAIYSMEMSGLSVARRLVSGESGVKTSAMKTGRISDDELPAFVAAIDKLSALSVHMSDCADWTTAQLRADLARLKAQAGIEWFLVDYLYLFRDGDDRTETEKTTTISRSLKRICRELELAGTAVHSVNKAGMGGGEEDARKSIPSNQNLRGSGQVVFDADIITFLTGYTAGHLVESIPQSQQKNLRVLWITKGRELEDPQKYILLVQKPGFPRFAEYAPDSPQYPTTRGAK